MSKNPKKDHKNEGTRSTMVLHTLYRHDDSIYIILISKFLGHHCFYCDKRLTILNALVAVVPARVKKDMYQCINVHQCAVCLTEIVSSR